MAAVAVGVGALVVPGLPAGAERVTAREDIGFTYRGTPVTCTVEGTSDFQYFSEAGQNSIYSRTAVVDPDPLCMEAISQVFASFRVRRSDGTEDFGHATGTEQAEAFVYLHGDPVVDMNATHQANFRCDDVSPRTFCMLSFDTNPK